MKLFTWILLFSLIGALQLQSQTYDKAYTVDYINSRTTDACKLFNSKKDLRIEFYSNGEPVRIDYIFPGSIDFEKGVYYADSEESIVVSCYKQAGKRIEREIIKHGSKLLYDRSNLQVTCAGSECEALSTAMKHLIQLYSVDDHERTQPFEEN